MALTNKLTAIGDAIRNKTGKTDKLTLDNMVTEINGITTGGEGVPEKLLKISGDCKYKFAYDNWNWVLEDYGDSITTENIKNTNFMFFDNPNITSIPFDFNFDNSTYYDYNNMFYSCNNLTQIGNLVNMYPSNMSRIFYQCKNLRVLPNFINLNLDRIYSDANGNLSQMFNDCFSLRSIPEELLKRLYTPKATGVGYTVFWNGFFNCYTLNEIKGLNPQTGTINNNIFYGTFDNCLRLKDIIFAKQDDGTVYNANWKSQTIDLSKYVGYTAGTAGLSNIINYNSGITADKEVIDDATYQSLKNDNDWFTRNIAYSRYNHDSAVNTINSLPDTSAYLTSSGGTNTIKFKGASGSATDGGAINTLTEEEIAVATAKGFTVTFV